jgi:hypothetical protein
MYYVNAESKQLKSDATLLTLVVVALGALVFLVSRLLSR